MSKNYLVYKYLPFVNVQNTFIECNATSERLFATLHRGFKPLCWVPVRDLAITMHFFGVNGFLWMKLTY